MELRTDLCLFISNIVALLLCANGERHAHVGLLETAPEYGTYPHKSSSDIYMDPCKACK